MPCSTHRYNTRGEEADEGAEKVLPSNARNFESHFEQLYCAPLGRGAELLCKDFCLLTNSGRLGVFATSSSVDTSPPPAPGAVRGVPAMESVTFHLVR